MVVVDFAQFVEVVDHQPRRLSHTMRRTICQLIRSTLAPLVNESVHGIERASARLASRR